MYTSQGRLVLEHGHPLAEVVATDPNAAETAGILAGQLNRANAYQELLDEISRAIAKYEAR